MEPKPTMSSHAIFTSTTLSGRINRSATKRLTRSIMRNRWRGDRFMRSVPASPLSTGESSLFTAIHRLSVSPRPPHCSPAYTYKERRYPEIFLRRRALLSKQWGPLHTSLAPLAIRTSLPAYLISWPPPFHSVLADPNTRRWRPFFKPGLS